MRVFDNNQRTILKDILKDILAKYNKQTITYNKDNNSVVVNGEFINIPKSSNRTVLSTRTTHTR